MKCINCEHGGNENGKYICYQLGIFWSKEVLDQDFRDQKCDNYSPLIDLGDVDCGKFYFDVSYPMKKLEKI